jgi:glucose-6-phosphate 1-dehydrogenase
MTKIDDCTLVLFGASGNLSRIKLIPGLFRLDSLGRLPEKIKILSVGRSDVKESAWRDDIKSMLDIKFKKNYDAKVFDRFIARNFYHANPPDDENAFKRLSERLSDASTFPQNLAFFLSVRPSDFASIVDLLAGVGLTDESKAWRRVVIEKPFGTNLETAQALQKSITKHLKETQIYRIDHYLGKSALQNILLTRFANHIFDPLWTHEHIDHIQITNNETLGVGERTKFYDATGALRDMIQSHLMQMLALTTMEIPLTLSPEHIRAEKIKVLESITPIPLDELKKHTFKAQYGRGKVNDEEVKGYLEELEDPTSVVETYAALKFYINTPRWKGVPIYVRTAKRLHASDTAIAIKFKKSPLSLPDQADNWLVISIQPKEFTRFEIQTKIPGLDTKVRTVAMDAPNRITGDESVDAYESLLLNLMQGDQSLYLHINEVEASWRLLDPVIKAWNEDKSQVFTYPAGSSDPAESKIIFDKPEQFWRQSIEIGENKL